MVAEPNNKYFEVRFLLIVFSPFILLFFLIYYIIITIKVGLKYVLPSIALAIIYFVLFLYAMSMGLIELPAKGYYDYVKSNVDINKIHQWLVNYEAPDYEFVNEDGTKRGRVFDCDWPECIKALNPTRGVLIGESEAKKYIIICHAVDIELSLGLCVMEEPMDVPKYSGAKRINLQENAFIWIAN